MKSIPIGQLRPASIKRRRSGEFEVEFADPFSTLRVVVAKSGDRARLVLHGPRLVQPDAPGAIELGLGDITLLSFRPVVPFDTAQDDTALTCAVLEDLALQQATEQLIVRNGEPEEFLALLDAIALSFAKPDHFAVTPTVRYDHDRRSRFHRVQTTQPPSQLNEYDHFINQHRLRARDALELILFDMEPVGWTQHVSTEGHICRQDIEWKGSAPHDASAHERMAARLLLLKRVRDAHPRLSRQPDPSKDLDKLLARVASAGWLDHAQDAFHIPEPRATA